MYSWKNSIVKGKGSGWSAISEKGNKKYISRKLQQ